MRPLGVVLGMILAWPCWATATDLDWWWSSAASGPFAEANNWFDHLTQTQHGIPNEFDSAIHKGRAVPYTVSSAMDEVIGRLLVRSSGNVADAVTYDFNGQRLTANGGSDGLAFGFDVANESGAGRLTLLDGQYQGNALRVTTPVAAAATARLVVGAGATLTTEPGDGLEFDQVGGRGASSTLIIQDGGVIDSQGLQIGLEPVDRGAVTVTGAGSRLQAVAPDASQVAQALGIFVGGEGQARIDLTNGALLRAQQYSIGGAASVVGSSGAGRIDVDAATLELAAVFDPETGERTTMAVGISGSGQINLTNQAQLHASGIIDLGGVSAAGTGAGSVGTIDARGGADLFTRELNIGRDLGCSGSIVLDGPGTTLLDIFGAQVGFRGQGSLTVSGGATARIAPNPDIEGAGFLHVGRHLTGVGIMTIKDPGSHVIVESDTLGAVVGRDGQGELVISGGGRLDVTSADLIIGRGPTAAGEITVTGQGSTIHAAKRISIGGVINSTLATGTLGSGQGALTLADGGSIRTTQLRIFANDSVALSAGGFGVIGADLHAPGTPDTLTVVSGGTLAGQGSIQGHVQVAAGGVLDPRGVGNTGMAQVPATLTLDGDLLAETGAVFRMRIERAGAAGVDYDSLQVSGTATLAGQLEIALLAEYIPHAGDEFNLIDGTSALVGSMTIEPRQLAPASGGLGPIVWGDYREADRYYLAPRRQADFNGVGGVSGADYTIWADAFGQTSATFGQGDANGDRLVSGADFTLWADGYGDPSLPDAPALTAIPEPSGLLLAAGAGAGLTLLGAAIRRRQGARKRPHPSARPS